VGGSSDFFFGPTNTAGGGRQAQAAEQGDAEAQFRLGSMYLGADTPSSQHRYVDAAEWFAKAAEQGHVGAQSMLGSLYFTGRGVPRDYVKAYMWSSIAATQGNSVSQEQLAELTPYMSSDEVAKAKNQSIAWLQKHGKASDVTPQHGGVKR
jgi:TPR repeat protein